LYSLNRNISTIGIFIAAIFMLIIYLLGVRYHNYLPTPIFFISIALIVATLIYQCLALKLDRNLALIIVAEIAMSNIVFHLIYQMSGYGLYGSDAYVDLSTLKGILSSGFVSGDPQFSQLTDFFPMIHILAAQLSIVTKIDFLHVAKWFPSLIDVAMIPFLYLLIRHLFKQEKVALLSILLFTVLQHHMLFSSLFIRETMALVFTICCLYFYFSANDSQHPVLYRALSIFFLVGVIFTHHLTCLMLIILLIVHILVSEYTRLPIMERTYSKENITGEKVTISFFLIAVVATSMYWVTHVIFTIKYMALFARDLISIGSWGQSTYLELTGISNAALPSVRYYFLIYGSYFCFIIFGLIIYRLVLFSKRFQKEIYSFFVYLILCALAGIAFTFILPRTIIGDRFLMYGWLFGVGPLFVAIFQSKQKWILRIGVSIVVVFVFINLFTIHPSLWNSQATTTSSMPSQEDYSMAKTMNVSQRTVLSTSNEILAIFDIQNQRGTDVFGLQGLLNMNDYQWVIINSVTTNQSEGIVYKFTADALSSMRNLNTVGDVYHNRVYESNNISVLEQK
jgi:hypothetical protein